MLRRKVIKIVCCGARTSFTGFGIDTVTTCYKCPFHGEHIFNTHKDRCSVNGHKGDQFTIIKKRRSKV